MKSEKVLEMLEQGRIEELKELIRIEVYNDSLKFKPGAKQRFGAMKRYFKYTTSSIEALTKPAVVEIDGSVYTSFCNSYSLALTTESTGPIELFDDVDRYPKVANLVKYDGKSDVVNFNEALATAKSKGYSLIKKEFSNNFKYVFKYADTYFKVGLLDLTYGIIDNGCDATVYHKGTNSPITIITDVGICVVMPVRLAEKASDGEDFIVIDL